MKYAIEVCYSLHFIRPENNTVAGKVKPEIEDVEKVISNQNFFIIK